MLNTGTQKLDDILTMGQPTIDRNGIGYTDVSNNIATFSKTVFVKIAHTIKVSPNSNKIDNSLASGVTNNVATTSKTMLVKAATIKENRHVSGKNSNPPLSEVKMKRFVLIFIIVICLVTFVLDALNI